MTASAKPLPLWDPAVEIPGPGAVPFLDHVTHVMVHRAVKGEYQFLHESSIAVHEGELVVAFANDPVDENSAEGIVRARRSRDGGASWSAPEVVAPGADGPDGRLCDNHVLLHSHEGTLYAYASRWAGNLGDDGTWHPLPSMRAVQFRYDPATGAWAETGVTIPHFLLMHGPQRLADGGWIIAGELGFDTPAVAISTDDRMSDWQTYPITTQRELVFPEPTILVYPDRLLAVIRHDFKIGPHQRYALVSESLDNGRTWSEAQVSNLPMVASKPFGGVLSNGQTFLVFNYPDPSLRRGNLVVGVGRPGEQVLCKLRTVRQGIPPLFMSGLCKEPQWSYPYAVEHDGALHVTYSISKEECAMSIIPLSNLEVEG